MNYVYEGPAEVNARGEYQKNTIDFLETMLLFEEEYPNGYGHKERFGVTFYIDAFNENLTVSFYKYNGILYDTCNMIPYELILRVNKVHDILYKK